MRHAVLIVAHRDFAHLSYLVNYFDSDFDVYIHIDKKCRFTSDEVYQLRHQDGVCGVYRKYEVKWGSYNFLKAILFLAEQVWKKGGVDYVHLISGVDMPVKGLDDFKHFFRKECKYEYLENFPLPSSRWTGGGLNRLRYYHLHGFLNMRQLKNRERQKRLTHFQDRWHLWRPISDRLPRLYGGGNWWSLSWECLCYVMEYTQKDRRLLRRLRFTFASDEIYFQTVIMNSPFARRVVNHHMRYIDWHYRNGNIPANLDNSDYEKIVCSPCLFARKMEFPTSGILVARLKEKIQN